MSRALSHPPISTHAPSEPRAPVSSTSQATANTSRRPANSAITAFEADNDKSRHPQAIADTSQPAKSSAGKQSAKGKGKAKARESTDEEDEEDNAEDKSGDDLDRHRKRRHVSPIAEEDELEEEEEEEVDELDEEGEFPVSN